MFQNLKVDLIYYKTNTDFEMEFNLCGCCRMRLLNDKAPDRKTAVHSLARAVSRSRIIMVVGSLFNEDNIIKIVSEAISYKLTALDCKAYGVISDDEIEIIEGSTPLVTSEGIFGGLIIESGPQTMILLTDNKTVRKTVMQTLIHPYVEELCAAELKEKAAENRKNDEVISDIIFEESPLIVPSEEEADPQDGEAYGYGGEVESDLILPDEDDSDFEFEPSSQNAAQPGFELITEQEEDIPEQSDGGEATKPETKERDVNGFFDTDSDSIVDSVEADQTTEQEQNEEYDNEAYEEEDILPMGKSSRTLNIFILCITVFLILVLAVLCYCIFYIPSLEGVSTSQYLKDIFNTLFGK